MVKYVILAFSLFLLFGTGHASADQTHTGDISGGSFTRQTDGVEGELVTIQGAKGENLNISGGTFSTTSPQIYTNGVVTTRDDNIRLYNASDQNENGTYNMHTSQSVEQAYKDGNTAQFAPANNPAAIPAKADVLKALDAAQKMRVTSRVNGWEVRSDENINITGGTFDFTTTNLASIRANGYLNWSNASLVSAGGGGAMTISAKDGINIYSGSIRSEGFNASGPYAIGYDSRGRLNRDRWTLGNYIYFMTDGDIVLGRKGQPGPEVYVGDGMVYFTSSTGGTAPGTLYINSGSLTLEGQYRSTLNTGSMASTIIDGGSLNVVTSDRINRNGVDSASMYLGDTILNSGAINLYNGQMGGAVTVNGGVVNAQGDSAINSTAKAVNINGGVVNLGPKAFIGAIRGDSLAISPYVTSSAEVNIARDAQVNLLMGNPVDGNIQVGRDIGGIYTINGSSPTSITIADGAVFNVLNPYAAGVGVFTIDDFAKAENGAVTSGNISTRSNPWYSLSLANKGDSASLTLTANDPAMAIASLPGNDNVLDNAYPFGSMILNGEGGWALYSAAIVGSDSEGAAEMLRQAGGESVTANQYAIMATMREMERSVHTRGFNPIGAVTDGVVNLENGNRVWINGVGVGASQQSHSDITGFYNDAAGVMAGFDHMFNDSFLLGVALGYARGYFKSNDSLAKGHSDNWYGSLYGSMKFDSIYLDADVFLARTTTDMDTEISGWDSSSDTVGATTFGASLKASYVFDFNDGATKIAPYAGIEYLGINQESWSTGGYLPRDFENEFSTLWTLPVGVNFSHAFKGEDWSLTALLGVGYARDLNDFRPEANVTIPGMTGSIQSKGPKLDKNSFRGEAGLNYSWKDLSVYLQYNLDARSRYTSHSGTLGVSWSF